MGSGTAEEDDAAKKGATSASVSSISASSGTAEEDDGAKKGATIYSALLDAILGAISAMGGPAVQPILMIINGFIAAQVGKAFKEATDDPSPDKLVALILRSLSGFS